MPQESQNREISETQWQELEKETQHEQKEFLKRYLKAEDEPLLISRKKNGEQYVREIRRGDHILFKGASGGLYDHHLLCTKVVEEKVKENEGKTITYIHTIEYGPRFGFLASSQSAKASNPLAFGAIKEGKLTYQQLINKKAKIRNWPEKLKRYSVDKVIERAESRKEERDYHHFNNNCEHFVTWCICGLNTSLQVYSVFKLIWDFVLGAGKAGFGYGVSEGVTELLLVVFEELFGEVSPQMIGSACCLLAPLGYVAVCMIEIGFAASKISEDSERKHDGFISDRQFKINTVATCSKLVGHVVGSIAGSIIGCAFGPLGILFGGAIGYGVGHVLGAAVGWCYGYAQNSRKLPRIKLLSQLRRWLTRALSLLKRPRNESKPLLERPGMESKPLLKRYGKESKPLLDRHGKEPKPLLKRHGKESKVYSRLSTHESNSHFDSLYY